MYVDSSEDWEERQNSCVRFIRVWYGMLLVGLVGVRNDYQLCSSVLSHCAVVCVHLCVCVSVCVMALAISTPFHFVWNVTSA